MTEILWTVVRFPDGSWSYGGSIDSPEYALCEKWSTFAVDGPTAVRLTQQRRRNAIRRAKTRKKRGDVKVMLQASPTANESD